MDAIEQFLQSWVKFVNCEVDENSFINMKMLGALVVKSNNGSDNKADVDIMTQELNQTESQVAKEDLWNNVLSISAIPNKQSNTGGDTQGAVELRNGWDFSKQAAKLKDPYIIDSDRKLAMIALNIIQDMIQEEKMPIKWIFLLEQILRLRLIIFGIILLLHQKNVFSSHIILQ